MSDEVVIEYDTNLNDAMLRVYDLQKLATFLEDHGVKNGLPKEIVDVLIDNASKEATDIGSEVAKLISQMIAEKAAGDGFEQLSDGHD